MKLLKNSHLRSDSDYLIEALQDQASRGGALLILRAEETLVASPDGRSAVYPGALAETVSGDQIEARIRALISDNWPAFEAACAALWTALGEA